jgi:hypothetical protein
MESGIFNNDVTGITAFTGSYPGKEPGEIKRNGYIFTPRTATKTFTSCVNGKPIEKGTKYYSVIPGGGGLGWTKRPNRILLTEIDEYLEKYQTTILKINCHNDSLPSDWL